EEVGRVGRGGAERTSGVHQRVLCAMRMPFQAVLFPATGAKAAASASHGAHSASNAGASFRA
ncbi:hypothetical protein CLOP_g25751, partial [Closterium sp. NIES-67]